MNHCSCISVSARNLCYGLWQVTCRWFWSRGDTGAMLGIWVLLFSRKNREWRNFQHCSAGSLSAHCCVGALVSPVWQFRAPVDKCIYSFTLLRPSKCWGGAGLGLCGPWYKKEVLAIIAELTASHNSNLLLSNCNNLALSHVPQGALALHTHVHTAVSPVPRHLWGASAPSLLPDEKQHVPLLDPRFEGQEDPWDSNSWAQLSASLLLLLFSELIGI